MKMLSSLFSREKVQSYPKISFREPAYLIDLPKSKSIKNVDVRYPLLEPLAFAHIKWDPVEKIVKYHVVEPKLTKEENALLEKIKADLNELIDVELSALPERKDAMEYLEKLIQKVLAEENLKPTSDEYVRIMYFVFRDFIGLNEIEPMMHDPYIEDIGCDGTGVPIYVVHRKFGSVETDVRFDGHDKLSNFVVKLAERCGRYISYATPLLDGSLPDGSRIQASLAKDVTTRGPTFSIRKFRKNPISPVELINMGTASSELMAYLWILIQSGASVLICGGVSTGKTSLLNAMTLFIPPEAKIVSIEDTRELNLPHTNWIPAVSRVGFGMPEASGKRYGEVTLFELLKESFRQNPDYVIVGEVRGKEAYVMFQGMASGHSCIGTIHAGSIEDVIKRLETPPIDLSPSLVESLDILIVMIRAKERGESSRRVKEIAEIQNVDAETGKARVLKSFLWNPAQDKYDSSITESDVLRRISFEKGVDFKRLMDDLQKRKNVLEWMQRHDIIKHAQVSEIVSMYYKDIETLMKWVEKDIHPSEDKAAAKKLSGFVTGLKSMK